MIPGFLSVLTNQPSCTEGDCPPSDNNVTLNQTLNADEGFSLSYPDDWSAAKLANVYQLRNVSADEVSPSDPVDLSRFAQIIVFAEERTDHAEAVRHLTDIEAEVDSRSTFLEIGGWPALQRQYVSAIPQPGQEEPDGTNEQTVVVLTTAVAADALLVRLEGSAPVDASEQLLAEIQAIGQSLTFPSPGDPSQVQAELDDLRDHSLGE